VASMLTTAYFERYREAKENKVKPTTINRHLSHQRSGFVTSYKRVTPRLVDFIPAFPACCRWHPQRVILRVFPQDPSPFGELMRLLTSGPQVSESVCIRSSGTLTGAETPLRLHNSSEISGNKRMLGIAWAPVKITVRALAYEREALCEFK
jgi:hypothetical protein